MFRKLLKSISDAIKPTPQSKAKLQCRDEIFIIDFISTRATGKTTEKAEVRFPVDSENIFINGKERVFNAYYVTNEGLSSDNLYYRIATPKNKFWVNPKDLARFMKVANQRHKMMAKDKKKREKTAKEDTKTAMLTPFDYDPITDEIYNCFITGKSGMAEPLGIAEKFNEVESQIAAICKNNNGKYYKSKSNKAKYVIILSPYNRIFSNVNNFREQGYRVTTFEKALLYFGIEHLWDCERMVQGENEFKELMKNK
ncbi:conserved hypothetical protein [Candidatus Desulfosporosinus infrequens]|uniref:Uncharacterized protein n=1 Tax=Candidatus Desulfosporosinus infrequens TaxID=2043169 RepID=A0A2U3LQ47_9FIRM|nr:conserved hypothetical protein [Candidatus Desulfosporosinus infrequens]